MASPGWYTLRELAAERGCTPDYLRQLIAAGGLEATKAGNTWLVARSEAQRLLATPRRVRAGIKGPHYDHFAAICPHGAGHWSRCDLNDRSRRVLKEGGV